MTEITDEQRAAWERITSSVAHRDYTSGADLALVAPLLPSELTNPQPVLPIEPGRYQDGTGDDKWKLESDGTWHYNSGRSLALAEVSDHAPFTRLVPERPQITRERVAAVYDAHHHPSDEAVDAIMQSLVNGADQ